MVKITYDENDAEQVKLIDDYFWYKYFCEVVRSDWKKFYEENKINHHIYKIISSNLNKYELEKAHRIHQITYNKLSNIPLWWVIDDILLGRPEKIYKQELIRKFKDNK